MQLHQLVIFCIFFALGSGLEIHSGNQAIHQTALWRRTHKTKKFDDDEKEKEKIARQSHYEHMMNISTALHDERTEYIGSIGVGTNNLGEAQFHARVVFDTGSTNLWVASVLCTAFPCDSGKQFYDPEKSLTQEAYEKEDGDIDIQFGTGELKGPLHVDTFRVGPMVSKRQPFGMIRSMEGDVFSSFPFEGILGLGFKSLSFSGIVPFFDHVIEQKLLPVNEFAFFFNVDSNKPSALLWGGVDNDLFHGPIHMFPVVQPHYWALKLVDFRLGEKSMKEAGMLGDPVKRLIVDSGTTYFTAPEAMHSMVTSQIPEAPCAEVTNYPTLTYVLEGADMQTYELVVSQETYMLGDEGENCRPAFMALDVSEQYGPAMILGEIFMRHFLTVFHRGDGSDTDAKIGFAPAKVDAMPKVREVDPPSFLQERVHDQKPKEIPPSSHRVVRKESSTMRRENTVAEKEWESQDAKKRNVVIQRHFSS